MKPEFNVTVLISGKGSNLKSLIDNAYNYRVTSVISSCHTAGGLEYAKQADIPCYSFDRSDFAKLRDQKIAIFEKAKALNPDLIALAGFMLLVQPEFVNFFQGRMINIHPSLLPAYPGLETHKRVLQAKEIGHGCSVHYVDLGIDNGPLIAQAALEVAPEDTEESLSSRVQKLEHKLFPWVLNNLASRRIALKNGKVIFDQSARRQAHDFGYILGESK